MTNKVNPQHSIGLPIKAAQKRIDSDRRFVPEPYKNVAKGMEQQFAQFMIEQMKKTTNSPEPNSSAMNYYKSLDTTERAKILTDTGNGLGIQNLILDQIYPKHLRNEAAFKQYQNQMDAQKLKKNEIEMAMQRPSLDNLESIKKTMTTENGQEKEK